LQTAEAWVAEREDVEIIAGPRRTYTIEDVGQLEGATHYFGDQVNFDKAAWLKGG
jgi:hypothetical protein